MDYSYPKKETVRLDCDTERAICDIKDTLKRVVSSLETLNSKVEKIASTEPVEPRD
jgi:hypothetical protein